jgi:O-antigen ligase
MRAPGGSFSASEAIAEIFGSVEWTPSLVAFMYYYVVVVTNRLPGADIAMVVAVAGLVLQLPTLRFGRVLALMGAFVVWAWCSYLATPYRVLALDQTWILTKLWIVVFVAYNVVRTRAQIRVFMALGVASFVFYPVRGAALNYLIGNTVFGRVAWNGTYGNPNDLAAFALIFASISVALFWTCRSRLVRFAASTSFAAILVLIFFTQSRGALLALGVVSLLLTIRKLGDPKVVIRGVLILGVAAALAPQGAWDRLSGLSKVSVESGMQGVDSEGSARQRYQILGIAIRIASDNPISGVGAGSYSTVHQQYARDYRAEFPFAGGKKDAHNTYAHTAAELGVVGLIIFLTCCLATIYQGFRASTKMGKQDAAVLRTLLIGLVGYLLAGIFASLEYINVLWLQLLLVECIVVAIAAPRGLQQRQQRVGDSSQRIARRVGGRGGTTSSQM